MNILRAEKLEKAYQTNSVAVKALSGIDFSVDRGEFVAIVGPSGSGKSTLLNIIGGLDTPTGGKVFLENKTQHQINIDKWGRIKVVLIPFIDSHGRQYMFGASMKLSEVDLALKKTVQELVFLSLIFLFIGFIFSYLWSHP